MKHVRAKLDTDSPNSQSVIMLAWDKAKAHIISLPSASLPREIFESFIEELTEEIDQSLNNYNKGNDNETS